MNDNVTIFWKWDFFFEIMPLLAKASWVTVYVTLSSFVIALILGLIFYILRKSSFRFISYPAMIIVEFIRSTPVLIQVFFIYYVLPDFGVVLEAIPAGIITLGVHYAAYCSEVYRSGIDNVNKGQWEACTSLNLPYQVSFWEIIIPQAIPPIIPNLGNYLIALFKDTPILSAIAIVELMQTAKIIGANYFRYIEPITLVGLFFLFFSLIAAGIVYWMEKYIHKKIFAF